MSPPVTRWPGPAVGLPRCRGTAPGRPWTRDAARTPLGAGLAAADPLVGPADQPVPAGHDEPGRGEGDLAQLGVAAGVLAPQPADDVDGLLGGGGELQPRVDGRAGVEAQVLGGEPAAEPPGEDLGDQGGGGAAWLLPAQPAGHRGLVVPQIEAVFEAELVHPAGEPGVGESGFCDERGELAVGGALRGSFRHQLCGLLPSGPRGAALVERRECSGRNGRSHDLRPAFIRSCEDCGRR